MASAIPELVEQLRSVDFNARALALAALVRRGKAATPALVEALRSPDDGLRMQAAQGLAEIADPACAETFADALRDSNKQVRARAAQGLARIKDGRALDALVQTIDDFPDVLHSPFTLSAYELIDIGPIALPAVAPLLRSADPMTRAHAFVVVRSIVSQLPEAGDWDQLWRSLGCYEPFGADPQRDRAADQWLTWIRQRTPM